MLKTKLKRGVSILIFMSLIFMVMSSSVIASGTEVRPRLGGGPSPSAAWTYNKSYNELFSHKQLGQINNKYQGIIGSSRYQAGKKAYNATLIAWGFIGKSFGAVSSGGIGLFGETYYSKIQDSANTIATDYGAGGYRLVKVVEYIRPANGEKMIIFK